MLTAIQSMQFDHFWETFIHLLSSDWSISEYLDTDWPHWVACPRFSLPQSIDILSFFVFGNKKVVLGLRLVGADHVTPCWLVIGC